MSERWSPFDPKWYSKAFDNYTSTAEQLFNTNDIIKEGYVIPDADGSKSSIFRNEAVLNNSFNEELLRETLKDIYLNSSHKLIASNHDNVHFFQWQGHMSDMTLKENEKTCTFVIPTDTFIYPNERDKFKLQQYYRKWIKVEDILNHWDVFKFCLLLFINQKIYSEYELMIDDVETTIQFKYNHYWIQKDFPVYIYKFDTNISTRILISKELCTNQWNWKVPSSYIKDPRFSSATNVMVYFNKISDQNIRKDGLTNIEVLGDNLEFLKFENGCIDLSHISDFNKQYILSEATEYLWMSIIVPKFFHEYPVLLPTDNIYRPYEANFQAVSTYHNKVVQHVKTNLNDDSKQVYVDLNGNLKESFEGWKQMIRPIVLTDAYLDYGTEPLNDLFLLVYTLRNLTVQGADAIESFRFSILGYISDDDFNFHIDNLLRIMDKIREADHALLDKLNTEYDQEYESRYKKFLSVMNDLKKDGIYSEWLVNFPKDEKSSDFWFMVSPLIFIPRELADKFYVVNNLNFLAVTKKDVLWEKSKDKTVRFQRPIDETDFWTFEFDTKDKVWRPYPLLIKRHFPDVYTLNESDEENPIINRIFKAFFFYSDSMNVLNTSRELTESTPSWDKDVDEYHFDQRAVYRDIFIEKFYWMGIKSIYKGFLTTNTRWEVIEYVIDNPSYDRFNQLFLNTMDPYFKLGLATYLKSANYQFPFDDAIDKMQEAIDTKWLGYKKVTNFEMYLNKTWIPSYFDYIVKIMEGYNYSDRWIKRPRSTFDTTRFIPILINIQENIYKDISDMNGDINWILKMLAREHYNLTISNITDLKDYVQQMHDNMQNVITFTKELDLAIYSIDDVNEIIKMLINHTNLIEYIDTKLSRIYGDAENKCVYVKKRELLDSMSILVTELPNHITPIVNTIQSFDMNEFMKAVNDLRSYFSYDKANDDDNSLIGHINKFDDPWSMDVKDARNKLFKSTSMLFGKFDPNKSYKSDEISEFVDIVESVKIDLNNLKTMIDEYYRAFRYEKDQMVYGKMDYVHQLLDSFVVMVDDYMSNREDLLENTSELTGWINAMLGYNISDTEKKYLEMILENVNDIIEALSYVVGTNNKGVADNALNAVEGTITVWNQFIDTEESVFDRIFNLSKADNIYLINIREHQDIINALISYMDSVNIDYIPDKSVPTYSDIYEINEIEITSGGFYHQIGDYVFVKNLGVYKITSINGKVATAIEIEDSGYRKTIFRDPMIQHNPYDTITDNNGMGIIIKPISSRRTTLINDEIIDMLIMNVKNILYVVKRNIDTYNAFNNATFRSDVDNISSLNMKWINIVDIYQIHMSDEMKSYADNLMKIVLTLIDPCNHFIEIREKITLSDFLTNFEKWIFNIYDYTEKIEKQDENFFYHDEKIREQYNTVLNFNGNGTSWSNGTQLSALLNETEKAITFYKHKIIDELDESEDINKINELYNELIDTISGIKNAIITLPNSLISINPIINNIESYIGNMPEQKKDVWYRFKYAGVANGGINYKEGDIVEIIPKLPTDELGNEIHDQEDIVMNDVILLQIKTIENGEVTKIEPLMDYALPYLLWGIRETKTRVGNGYGLTIDAYSSEISLGDSTVFEVKKLDDPNIPKFNENDLFAFRFENIHDLDMNYEVFIGGKQIQNFFYRHISTDNPLYPKEIDVIYINANEIMSLQKTSMTINTDHSFISKMDKLEVKDSGAGYSEGQIIYVDTGNAMLKMKITKLTNDPCKGIAEVELVDESNSVDNSVDTEEATVITDSLNNIDDEYNIGYYDRLPQEGIQKQLVHSITSDEYMMTSKRFDELKNGDRNDVFMYPDVGNVNKDDKIKYGDPDEKWYQGSRAGDERIWNGVMNVIPPTDPFIPDSLRLPEGKPIKGEYQLISRERIHNSINEINVNVNSKFTESVINNAMVSGDLSVPDFASLPKHVEDFPKGAVGKVVIVECDETNYGHRMAYKIRTFIASGHFIYDIPEIADYSWNEFHINWMDIDCYQDEPTLKAQFLSADWNNKTYNMIQHDIVDGKVIHEVEPKSIGTTSYIHDLTVDDLSVFNWTTKEWEDLHDETRWQLTVVNNSLYNEYGFTLKFLLDGTYSYDMMLYLNKTPETLKKNAVLKRNAVLLLKTSIVGEVMSKSIEALVNTSNNLRIRKLFPFEQKESYTIGFAKDKTPLGYEMDFKIANYLFFKNELHLEDIKVFNKTANRFEDILDETKFEVRFKDPKATNKGFETQTKVTQALIGNAGKNFYDGQVWGYNEEFDIHVFGIVTADYVKDGHLLSFEVIHCVNMPKENIQLEFNVFQYDSQTEAQMAVVMIEFQTEKVEVHGDGYIHNVRNRLAPLPKEFKVIVQYDLDGPYDYEIILSKTQRKWTFIEPNWLMNPTFHIKNYNIQQDRLYVLTSNGRFPLVNPSTGKPTLHAVQTENGTDVTFLNLYRRYEHMNICSTPYPMRSVYVKRHIPSHGFINLKGKINKPLNKKYFEFWVNGRLLYDEVTIITPTKIVLHGLTSLKNLEIIEVNRDSNEYFSDNFLSVSKVPYGRSYVEWDFDTYLDAALEGRLDGDNYTEDEQEFLLSPVWKQVDERHPEFKNYPPNVDIEDDILLRTNPEDYPINDLENPSYQFLVINQPTLEGKPIVEQSLTFKHFGFTPLTNAMLIDLMNEEWSEEISSNPYFPEHTVLSDADWYGLTARLYDEYGILVHTLDESMYHVTDQNLLKINIENKLSRIIRNPNIYDLT